MSTQQDVVAVDAVKDHEMVTLAMPLGRIGEGRLADIPLGLAARVVRRIVDDESLTPRLDVAAFNSAH